MRLVKGCGASRMSIRIELDGDAGPHHMSWSGSPRQFTVDRLAKLLLEKLALAAAAYERATWRT